LVVLRVFHEDAVAQIRASVIVPAAFEHDGQAFFEQGWFLTRVDDEDVDVVVGDGEAAAGITAEALDVDVDVGGFVVEFDGITVDDSLEPEACRAELVSLFDGFVGVAVEERSVTGCPGDTADRGGENDEDGDRTVATQTAPTSRCVGVPWREVEAAVVVIAVVGQIRILWGHSQRRSSAGTCRPMRRPRMMVEAMKTPSVTRLT